jgi:hypothetical protein
MFYTQSLCLLFDFKVELKVLVLKSQIILPSAPDGRCFTLKRRMGLVPEHVHA